MNFLRILFISLSLTAIEGANSKANEAAADLVTFFKETGSNMIAYNSFYSLMENWMKIHRQQGDDFYPVPTEPDYDFLSALYENVPLNSDERSQLYWMISRQPLIHKLHHFSTFCRTIDPSAVPLKLPERTFGSLNDNEKTSVVKKIMNHCWRNDPALKYLKILLENIPIYSLVKEIARENPEQLIALLKLELKLSIKHFYAMLKLGKSDKLSTELKTRIIMPLIRAAIFDSECYDKLKSVLELAARNWNDTKFGGALGDYKGYIPCSPRVILLLLDYGFNLNCERKSVYIQRMQSFWKVFQMFQLADGDSVLSILPEDIRSLLFGILTLDALPARRKFTVRRANRSIQVDMPDTDNVDELIQKACKLLGSHNADQWLLYQSPVYLDLQRMVEDIDAEKELILHYDQQQELADFLRK